MWVTDYKFTENRDFLKGFSFLHLTKFIVMPIKITRVCPLFYEKKDHYDIFLILFSAWIYTKPKGI